MDAKREADVIYVAEAHYRSQEWKRIFRTTYSNGSEGPREKGGADSILERSGQWLHLEAKATYEADTRRSSAFVSALGVIVKRMRTEARTAGGGCNDPKECFAGATKREREGNRESFLTGAVFNCSQYVIALPVEYQRRVEEFSPGIAGMLKLRFLLVDFAQRIVIEYVGAPTGWRRTASQWLLDSEGSA